MERPRRGATEMTQTRSNPAEPSLPGQGAKQAKKPSALFRSWHTSQGTEMSRPHPSLPEFLTHRILRNHKPGCFRP